MNAREAIATGYRNLLGMLLPVWLLWISPAQASDEKPDARSALDQLGIYDPMYFIVGEDDGLNAKFQVSFEYQLFSTEGLIGTTVPATKNVYLSYSQTSLWDLSALSGPFRDSSYRPRLFYKYERPSETAGHWVESMEIGLGHESNGRAGLASRSLSIVYVRPDIVFATSANSRFSIRPLIYAYVDDDENPDIADYRGYVDLDLSYSWTTAANGRGHDWKVWVTLRKGSRSDYGSVEANIAMPLSRLIHPKVNGWLMAQYFDGYGESLLSYDRKESSQARIGLAIMF